jgi:HAD superfamily hydrolase (TIGR01549 family)
MFESFQTILWDFDGVILDSVHIRDQGYWHVLNEYPKDQIKKLIKFQQINGGLSRYVKFRYFYEEILEREISEEKVNDLAGQYSEFMRKRLTDAKLLIEDTMDFIRSNHGKYNMHIVSGSDQNELQFLCRELEIDFYFKSVLGSPTPKITLVKNILDDENYIPEHVVLIGDSINDYEAAENNDLTFYGYNNPDIKDKGERYVTEFP